MTKMLIWDVFAWTQDIQSGRSPSSCSKLNMQMPCDLKELLWRACRMGTRCQGLRHSRLSWTSWNRASSESSSVACPGAASASMAVHLSMASCVAARIPLIYHETLHERLVPLPVPPASRMHSLAVSCMYGTENVRGFLHEGILVYSVCLAQHGGDA